MPRLSESRGVTLIEVLVSMLVLTGGVLGAMKVFDLAHETSGAAERIDVAANLGDRAMEDLRALPYADIAVREVPAPPGGVDPPAEEPVAYDPASPHPAYEEVTIGPRRFAVHRFVSWRDEECPVADLTSIDSALADLQGTLGSVHGTLTALVGPGGTLTSTLTDADGLLSGGLLGALGLGSLLNAVGQVAAVLEPAEALLTPLLSPLDGTLGALDGVLDPVTGRLSDTLDLCDLPSGAIPDLHELEALTQALQALDPVLAVTQPVVEHVGALVDSLVGLNVLGLLSAVVKAPAILADTVTLAARLVDLQSVLDGVVDTLGEPVQLATLAARVTDGLTDLLAFIGAPDTTHNTKRISVAVSSLDGPGAKRKPMWFSTVVTDPRDGLL